MKTEILFRTIMVVLLASILAVQITILNRTPKLVTMQTLKQAKADKAALEESLPIVRIAGGVDVNVQNDFLYIENKPFTPLQVQSN